MPPNLSAGAVNHDFIIIRDVKGSGVPGGNFTAGGWVVRDLNTFQYTRETNPNWIAVFANTLILQPGTYFVEGSAPAYKVNRHATQFQNTTDATTAIVGTSEYCASADATQTRSFIVGGFTITAPTEFQLQHRCQTTSNTFGLGVDTVFGDSIYSEIMIIKLK